MRQPIYFVYLLHQHMRDIAGKQHWLSHDLDAEAIATQLRHLAAEERWNHPEKTNAPKDFFYHNDPKLPEALRRLGPSWVEISSDERIDVGCGEVMREETYSFGISVWRDPTAAGYGTKRLGNGIWYYEQKSATP